MLITIIACRRLLLSLGLPIPPRNFSKTSMREIGSGIDYLIKLTSQCAAIGLGALGTVTGAYYAFDTCMISTNGSLYRNPISNLGRKHPS